MSDTEHNNREDHDIEQVLPEHSKHKTIPQNTFFYSFGKTSKLSLQTAASYTISMQLCLLVYLLSQLDDDEEHLAAITLITSLINSVVGIGVSPLLAMSLVAGKELGELRDAERQGESEEQLQLRREHISAVFGNGLLISLVMSPVMITALSCSKPLLMHVFGQNEIVAGIAQDFMLPYSSAIPAIMVRISAEQVMFTFERTKPAMLIGLTNFTLSMSLGSVLAFGPPKLGVTGILTGCILESYLTAAGYSLYIAHSPRLKEFHFFDLYKPWQPYLNQLTNIRSLARSIFFSISVDNGMYLMTNLFAGIIGVQQQAALSSIMQFSLFSFLLQLAFGQVAAQELSRNIGGNDFNRASTMGKAALVAMLTYMVPVLLFLSAYPRALTDTMEQQNQSINKLLTILAPIMFIGCALDATRFALLQQLRILGDSSASTYTSFSCVGLSIALSGVLGLKTNMGIYGVATGFTTGTGLATAILLTRWINRIEPQAIEENKTHPKPELSFKNSCVTFFSKKPCLPSVTDNELQMTVNPIQSRYSTSA